MDKTTKATTAERIAALFCGDGQRYELDDGRDLCEVCDAEDVRTRYAVDDAGTKWLFRDGSAIVDHGAGWDIGLDARCSCMMGAGHAPWCCVGSASAERTYDCPSCGERRDRDDPTTAPCARCGSCAVCAPTAGGAGGSELCGSCEEASR